MRVNRTVARSVGLVLAAHSAAAWCATPAAADAEAAGGLQEITVTAQRRSENVQDVPIAIQAFTSESLQQLNVGNFEELLKFLPNVSASSAGPGQTQIFMRGLSNTSQGTQSGGSIAGFPNVAIYLDDQSGQLPGRNLDVYAADLERIEVLEGPQGTLFGAGAQAGVIRYITNKPRLNVTEGSVKAGYGVTTGGDPNTDLTAVVNVPILEDRLAVRGAIYYDRRGGYIDNVPATFTRRDTDLGIKYANYATGCTTGAPLDGACAGGPTANPATAFGVPPGSPVINNYNIARNAINPVTYQGARAEALWNFNDDWNALLSQSYQTIDAQGVFYQMPRSSDGDPLPARSVTLFNDSYNKDRFENTSLTINGRIGMLRAVYTGAYLVRHVDQIQDYTNYARGVYADYYQCHGPNPANNVQSQCYSPSSVWTDTERNTHQSHEFRLSTPDDWRLRGILGAFWEQLDVNDRLNWQYKSLPPCQSATDLGCMTDVAPAPGSSATDPSIRNDKVAFFNDVTRGYKQLAFFTSIDFDLIPKVLTFTAGTRWYRFTNDEKGAVTGSFGCYQAGPAPCLASATNIDAEHLHNIQTGEKSRLNLTWHLTPDVLAWYTWSQGFRPGAFNRSSGCYIPDASGNKLYCSPLAYASDDLTNNELGWKSEFLGHRLQFNGALYQEDWKNVQTPFFDPGVLGNVGFGVNGPDYRVRGVETSLVAVLTEGLTGQAAASWNSSEQTNSPLLIANNPALAGSPEYGKPITSVVNPYGPLGSPTANSPPFQFNARLRYQFNVSAFRLFVQASVTHSAHSFTQSGSNPPLSVNGQVSTTQLRFENPGYTLYDASAGLARDAWTAELYVQNLSNVNTSLFTSTTQFVPAQTVTRPRVIAVQLGYRF